MLQVTDLISYDIMDSKKTLFIAGFTQFKLKKGEIRVSPLEILV